MKDNTIFKIVLQSVQEILTEEEDLESVQIDDINEETPLLGQNSILDSLSLVSAIVNIEQKLNEEMGINITIEYYSPLLKERRLTELEKNIEKIRYKSKINKRGGNSGKPIINPKLPIIINEDFVEILGHICGDGTISRSNIKKGVGFRYINSEPYLIENFKKLVKKVFGEIEPNIQVRKGKKYTRPNYCLQYPSIISLFILSIFDYQTKEKMDLPNFILKSSKKSRCLFLRALFDDEGTISHKEKAITIGLKPIKPIMEKNTPIFVVAANLIPKPTIKMIIPAIKVRTLTICMYCHILPVFNDVFLTNASHIFLSSTSISLRKIPPLK